MSESRAAATAILFFRRQCESPSDSQVKIKEKVTATQGGIVGVILMSFLHSK